jgi:hypothetical protein
MGRLRAKEDDENLFGQRKPEAVVAVAVELLAGLPRTTEH